MHYGNMRNDKMVFISGDQPKFDGNTFSVRTEPGAQAMKLPEPIPILGRECPYVDVRYKGDMNLADNTVNVAAMDQDGSEWRKVDSAIMKLRYHYLGLAMKRDDKNLAFNKQFRITQEQAISSAYATQLTELEFMAEKISSDIPEMEGIQVDADDDVVDASVFTGSGQFASLVWDQAFLQNTALIMAKYNTLMSFCDYLLKMGYNAESAMTLRFLNMMKKQNVWTVFDQLGNILTSQFFDLDFYNEITCINAVPCRKRDEVGSPLITLTGSVVMPGISMLSSNADDKMTMDWATGLRTDLGANRAHWVKRALATLEAAEEKWMTPFVFTIQPPMYQSGGAWVRYNSWLAFYNAEKTTQDATVIARAQNHARDLDSKRSRYMVTYNGETYDMNQLVEKICELLSPHEILKWARNRYFSNEPMGSISRTDDPAKDRVNSIIALVGGLIDVTSHFRSDTVDLLTFLKVMQNSTTMNHWVLDTPYLHPALPRAQVTPKYFKLVYDILTSYGTSGDLVLDENTMGWDIFTWWHASEGIPKYDAYDGGFTIAASIRGIPSSAGADYSEPQYMVPRLFEVVPDSIKFLTRRGEERQLSAVAVAGSAFAADPVWAGAVLMDKPSNLYIPQISFNGESNVDARTYSQMIRTLSDLFGIGQVILADNSTIRFMDPAMEGLIGRTFGNSNTMSLTYINGRAPFRVTSTSGGLGFEFR